MHIVNDLHAVKARLAAPTGAGFLVLAAELGSWAGPIPLPSRTRRRTLDRAARLCAGLAVHEGVSEATTFRAVLRPPGEGARILRDAGVRPARYDIVVLIRTESIDLLDALRATPDWCELVRVLGDSARSMHLLGADSPARIADVDHERDDWFLFNYFHCADTGTVYDVWEYTAGWFQHKTALPNSALMRPLPGEPADYSLINHASWPHLWTFLPGLLFRPTFRSFVLANLAANGIAAQPIIYRRLR